MIDKDHCIYIKQNKDKCIIIFIHGWYTYSYKWFGVHLNHLSMLSFTFDMKDMGEASYILGVKIHSDRSHKLVTLLQEHYIKNILEWFNMQYYNPIDTPFSRGENLSKEIGPKTPKEKRKRTNVPYSSVVGSLMYATMCTTLYIYLQCC